MSSRTGSRMLSLPMGRRMQGKDKVNIWLCVRAGIKLPFFGFFSLDVISHYFHFFSKSKDGSSSSGMRALWQGLCLQMGTDSQRLSLTLAPGWLCPEGW